MRSFVVIEFAGQVGGLGDRICGLVSAILMSKILSKTLLIKWDNPSIHGVFQLGSHDFYSVRPSIDVTLDTIDNRFRFEKLLSREPIHQMWKTKTILLRCNQEIALWLYSNPYLKTGHYTEDVLSSYRSVFTHYLKPLCSANPIPSPYIGIQLRTGDAYMGVGNHRPVHDLGPVLINLAAWVKTQGYQNVYFTTDHPLAKSQFQAMVPHCNVFDQPAARVHLERSHAATSQLRSLVSDLLTLIQAHQMIISVYSNFGRVAALMSPSTFVMGFSPPAFTIFPVDLTSLFSKHHEKVPHGSQRRSRFSSKSSLSRSRSRSRTKLVKARSTSRLRFSPPRPSFLHLRMAGKRIFHSRSGVTRYHRPVRFRPRHVFHR